MSILDEFELEIKIEEEKKMKKFLKAIKDTTEFIVGKKKVMPKAKPKKKRTYKRRSKK